MNSSVLKSGPLSKGIKLLQNFHLANYSTAAECNKYKTLAISTPKPFVYQVQLNRPTVLNAINDAMWQEFRKCFDELADSSECRVIVLSGAGKLFCAGIDLYDIMSLGQQLSKHKDVARRCKVVERKIKSYQDSLTSIEKCQKPVIAAVHGACIGAGVDMICAADIRYCSSDAWFQVKEVALGMAADVGTLQRLPKVIGSDSLVRELAYTGRKFPAAEALQTGFVNRIFDNEQDLIAKSIELAEDIASKSPVAVQGIKLSLNYSRDHSVQEGLDHIAMRNQTMLQSEDFANAAMAQAAKGDPPVFSKL